MPPRNITIPRWAAIVFGPLVFIVLVPVIHGVLPWAISRIGHRYGWLRGVPAVWNLLGLIPVAAGIVVLLWLLIQGLAQGPALPEQVALDWSPKTLIMRGPYRFSRHPMYLAEAALWLGWSIVYGSVLVFIGLLLLCTGVSVVAPREERELESVFGEAYRLYRKRVPRWLGKPAFQRLRFR